MKKTRQFRCEGNFVYINHLYIVQILASAMLQKMRQNKQGLFQCCGNVPLPLNHPPCMPISSKTGKISLKNQQRKRAESQKLNSSKYSQESLTQPERSCPMIQSRPRVSFSFLQAKLSHKDDESRKKGDCFLLTDAPKEEIMMRSEPVQTNNKHYTSLTGLLDQIDREEKAQLCIRNKVNHIIMNSLSDTESQEYSESIEEAISIVKLSSQQYKKCSVVIKQNSQKDNPESKKRAAIWESCPSRQKTQSFSTTFSSQISALRKKKTDKEYLFKGMQKTKTLKSNDEIIFELLDDAELIEDYRIMMKNVKDNEDELSIYDIE